MDIPNLVDDGFLLTTVKHLAVSSVSELVKSLSFKILGLKRPAVLDYGDDLIF